MTASPGRRTLVIDARPRGPEGPLADARVQGRTVLDHLLDLAEGSADAALPVPVHARLDEHPLFAGPVAARGDGQFALAVGPPPAGAAVLRADRLYDPSRLRKALKRGQDPERAVLWRLDRPAGLAGAADELERRRSYQPLGRFWAFAPARRLAEALAPTRVRPNAVTLAASGLVLTAAAAVAFGPASTFFRATSALLLATALVLDTADGRLARLQGTATPFGRWLDGWLDEVGDMALHAAAAWSAYARTGAPGWLMIGTLYAAGKYVFAAGATSWDQQNPAPAGESVPRATPPSASPIARAVRAAGHADVRWHLWIVLAALGRLDLALAAYALYYPARALAGLRAKAVGRG